MLAASFSAVKHQAASGHPTDLSDIYLLKDIPAEKLADLHAIIDELNKSNIEGR